MPRRKWEADRKAKSVIQGLQGRPVAALCNEYQSSPCLSAQGRAPLLAKASRAFDVQPGDRREARLARENVRLHARVGDLTGELKTRDEWLG